MASQGEIALTSALTLISMSHVFLYRLKSTLYVPKLSAKLLSIHQITKDLNYTVTFFPSYCMTQDRAMMRMIGHAKE